MNLKLPFPFPSPLYSCMVWLLTVFFLSFFPTPTTTFLVTWSREIATGAKLELDQLYTASCVSFAIPAAPWSLALLLLSFSLQRFPNFFLGGGVRCFEKLCLFTSPEQLYCVQKIYIARKCCHSKNCSFFLLFSFFPGRSRDTLLVIVIPPFLLPALSLFFSRNEKKKNLRN